jgi:hypothetical protein
VNPVTDTRDNIFWSNSEHEKAEASDSWQRKKNEIVLLLRLRDWVPRYCGHYWPIVPAPGGRWWWFWNNWWNEYWHGKPKYSEKHCPITTLAITNPTWPDPSSNPGHSDVKTELYIYFLPLIQAHMLCIINTSFLVYLMTLSQMRIVKLGDDSEKNFKDWEKKKRLWRISWFCCRVCSE